MVYVGKRWSRKIGLESSEFRIKSSLVCILRPKALQIPGIGLVNFWWQSITCGLPKSLPGMTAAAKSTYPVEASDQQMHASGNFEAHLKDHTKHHP